MVAKERLWQMDFISYAAAGRISELIGDKALDFDRYNRRIGMLSAAKKTVELTEKVPQPLRQVKRFCSHQEK